MGQEKGEQPPTGEESKDIDSPSTLKGSSTLCSAGTTAPQQLHPPVEQRVQLGAQLLGHGCSLVSVQVLCF